MNVNYAGLPEASGYRFGDDGSIESRWLFIGGKDGWLISDRWKQLKPTVGSHGYAQVVIAGVGSRTVHSLILEAFVGPCPEGKQACHRDGNELNNRLENLRYGTPIENAADQLRHGTIAIGSRNGRAKLQEISVNRIDRLRDSGWSYAKIGMALGVDTDTVRSAHLRETWRHVPRLATV